MKVCGVAAAMPQGHSWAPFSTNGSARMGCQNWNMTSELLLCRRPVLVNEPAKDGLAGNQYSRYVRDWRGRAGRPIEARARRKAERQASGPIRRLVSCSLCVVQGSNARVGRG